MSLTTEAFIFPKVFPAKVTFLGRSDRQHFGCLRNTYGFDIYMTAKVFFGIMRECAKFLFPTLIPYSEFFVVLRFSSRQKHSQHGKLFLFSSNSNQDSARKGVPMEGGSVYIYVSIIFWFTWRSVFPAKLNYFGHVTLAQKQKAMAKRNQPRMSKIYAFDFN